MWQGVLRVWVVNHKHNKPINAPHLQHVRLCRVVVVHGCSCQLLHEAHDSSSITPEALTTNSHAHKGHTLKGLGTKQPGRKRRRGGGGGVGVEGVHCQTVKGCTGSATVSRACCQCGQVTSQALSSSSLNFASSPHTPPLPR